MRWLAATLFSIPLLCSAMSAKSYIVMDMEGNVLKAENADEERPIASITKLVTTERNSMLSQDELITILQEDVRAGRMRSSVLKAGMQVKRSALMELALICSDNIAAIALGRTESPLRVLPPHTTIVEASGLDARNRSTAHELADIARSLYNTELAATSVHESVTYGSALRRSTNPLIGKQGWNFYLSKTGFTNPAGGCLVVITKINDRILTIVILGARDAHQRWRDLIELRHELDDTKFYAPLFQAAHPKKRHVRYGHP